MELRLVSDPLLRSQISPLSFRLTPIPLRWRSTTAPRQVRLLMPILPRCTTSSFHTTVRKRADSSSTAADLDFLEDMSWSKPKQALPSPSSQRRPTDDVLSNQLDSLFHSTFQTPNPAKRKPHQTADESSATIIGNAFHNSHTRDWNKKYTDIAQRMQYPPEELTSPGTPRNVIRDAYGAFANERKSAKRAVRTVRSRPSIGRTIEVIPERGVDFGRALRSLEITCAVNRVKSDLSRQRFHERPGLKRKRLKSERWRKMFKESFRATVRRVKEMTRKGW